MLQKISLFKILAVVCFICVPSQFFSQGAEGNLHKFIEQINNYRKEGCHCGQELMPPAQPLEYNEKLGSLALSHSVYMDSKNKLSHIGEGNSDPGQRMSQGGYIWKRYAENIGMGYLNASQALEGWMKSIPHCKNIMDPNLKEMGLGAAGKFWTLKLGSR